VSALVAVSSGSAAETRTFTESRYATRLAAVTYTGGPAPELDGAAAVWVPEGTPQRRLRALAPRLDAVLARGGAVLLFGDLRR
jgi:hypothetical protein